MPSRLVGREPELLGSWGALTSGARVAVITGEPGSGKTALLAAVGDRARAEGWRVIALRGRPTERALPYAGAVDLLTAREVPVTDAQRDEAARIAAGLTGAGPVDGPVDRPVDGLGLRLALLAWLTDLGAEAPLLVTVDDQHWLDDTSWSVLAFVANRVAGTRVSFLVATRHAAGPVGLEDRPPTPLGPLGLEHALAVLDSLDLALDPLLRTAITERAGGNPLALREFARAASGATGSDQVRDAETLPVPPLVEEAFAGELPRLPETTRSTLLLAAAGGADLGVLGRVLDPEDLAGHLGPAEAAGLVSTVDGRVRFRHPLVRSAVYTRAATADRVAAHTVLAEAYAADDDRRAWHRAAASLRPDGGLADDLERTAVGARQQGAWSEAARAMLRAAELSPDPAERQRRQLEALALLGQSGHISRLQAVSERVRAETTDPAVRAVAAHRVAYALAQSMRQAAAQDALEGALDELVAVDPESGWASLTTLASLCYQTGRGQERLRAWVERFRAEAPVPPEPAAELNRAAQAWIEVALDPLSRPVALVEGVRDARPLDAELPPDLVVAHEMLLGATAWLLDEPEVAARRLEKSLLGVRRGHAPGHLPQLLMALGQVYADRGSYARAADVARQLVDLAEAENLGHYRLVGRELLARVAAVVGAPGDAARDAEAVLLGLEVGECTALETNLQLTLARTAFMAGDPQDGFRRARELFDRDGRPVHAHVCLRALGDIAAAAVRAGERGAVLGVVEHARTALAGTANRRYAVILHRALALVDETDEAEAHFQRATTDPVAALWPLELANARLGYGVWLRRRRRTAHARVELAAAHDLFVRLGARTSTELAEHELRAAGVAQPVSAGWVDLTAQEQQIVRLAAAGLTNREIGTRLFLSPRTVSTHLYRAFPKLGVTSRAQLRDAVEERGADGEA